MATLVLDHVAIAVPSLDETTALHESLAGSSSSPPETLASQGVRISCVGSVELLEPLASDTPVGRFLSRHGSGFHHLAFRTTDLEAELVRLSRAGFELVDPEPRPRARGHRVAFLHPRSTGRVLIELVETEW